MSGVELVRRFCLEWPGLPPEQIGDFFTNDCAYEHVSLARPLVGPRSIAGAIEIYRARFEQIECDILHMAESDGVVLCHRVEQFGLPGGRVVRLPGMSAVEIRDDKIAYWRDYFDLEALRRQVDLTEA